MFCFVEQGGIRSFHEYAKVENRLFFFIHVIRNGACIEFFSNAWTMHVFGKLLPELKLLRIHEKAQFNVGLKQSYLNFILQSR